MAMHEMRMIKRCTTLISNVFLLRQVFDEKGAHAPSLYTMKNDAKMFESIYEVVTEIQRICMSYGDVAKLAGVKNPRWVEEQ